MSRDSVVSALNATKDPVEEKNADNFLDEQLDPQELGSSISRRRTTTSSNDGADWHNLGVLTNDDAPLPYKAKISNRETEKRERVDDLIELWRSAARKAVKIIQDPWFHFFVSEIPIMKARRYRYSSIRKSWSEDTVEIRLLQEPFARGAVRECYRLKKLPSNSRVHDWKYAHNYVAKRYMQEVNRSVFFEDVRLQMDAKLWAEEYNRYNPPKRSILFKCVFSKSSTCHLNLCFISNTLSRVSTSSTTRIQALFPKLHVKHHKRFHISHSRGQAIR
ncbi:Alpha kinase [Parelaphostrongylus tenuis]|uniref:Alpha kinase n=1 Tax=Parelaphostrongylus tenuis TaxID=148309 RepID=A0AAD5MQC6_PARTN|nr:Alpha kinase [Parelaphostrongylus tenuis]